VRGVIGTALTADVALKYAAAFGTFLKSGKVAVGGDTRRTGPMVRSAAVAGLLATGHDIVDIGICPTPTVELAVRDGGFVGGIAVTASHNHDRYNALKLIGDGGVFLSASEATRVSSIYEGDKIKYVGWENVGLPAQDYGWVDYHIDKILALDVISPGEISRRQLKVVADCVGSTAAVMAAKFFSCLGVGYQLINSQIGERFPHPAEPLPENLGDLCRAVKAARADIGLAFDPDSDRLAIVTDKGEPLGEEYTLALGCRYILTRETGPIAVNVSSSLLNDAVAREAGIRIYRSRVGERNVTEKLMKIKGVAGGEGNGGLIYPRLHWGRDGFLAAAIILQYLASAEKSISQIASELPSYVMLKTKISGTRRDVERKKGSIKRIFPGAKIDELDGVKIYDGNWWVQIRASNTEPILRLMAEADSDAKAKKLIAAVKSVFRK